MATKNPLSQANDPVGNGAFRLVHERSIVTRGHGGRLTGYVGVPANDEFVLLSSKGWFDVYGIATGRVKFRYRHPDVARWYKNQSFNVDTIIIDCTIPATGKYYVMSDMLNVLPSTTLDVNVIHSLKLLRNRYIDYRTGETAFEFDFTRHELGQHASGGYREADVSPTFSYEFFVGPVPPEGRLASVDVKTGKVHRMGPQLEWGYPHPHTPPVFGAAGGDWILAGRRAPRLWNARTGEDGPALDVDGARRWCEANPPLRPPDLYGGLLVGGMPGADANDLHGRVLVSGGHAFDAATGRWLAKTTNATTWFTGDAGVTSGLHGGWLITPGGFTNKQGTGAGTTYRQGLWGFNPATRDTRLLAEATFGVAVRPAGIPDRLVKTARLSGTGTAWTPDGRRLVVASGMEVRLDMRPCIEECERRWPGMLMDVVAVPRRRVLWRKECKKDLLAKARKMVVAESEAGGAIITAAEAWSESGLVAVEDASAPGGLRAITGSGPDGELDARDVVRAIKPADWSQTGYMFENIEDFMPWHEVLVQRLQVDVFRLERVERE